MAFLSSFLFTGIVWAQAHETKVNDALVAAIDKLVEKAGVTADGPGVAICVRQPGKLLFQKGYGLSNVEDGTPITPRTMFELASVTKSFTAVAVLILHEQGKLSIDDDVRRHLPELPEYNKARPIRLRDLLQHVSGLPDYMGLEDVPVRNKSYWVDADYAADFARQRAKHPLDFPTGARYEYNNTNYMLLGLVVERVARQSFGTFLREAVLTPAGMQNSFVYESPTAVPKQAGPASTPAIGYEWGKKRSAWRPSWGCPPARQETLLTVGDGGLWSNLHDMAQWDIALREGKLLKPATMQLALAPSKTRDGETNQYGLGWSLYPDGAGGLTGYGHDGSWGGFRTSYYRYLAADRTTVILSNRGDFDTDKFWYALDAVIEKHLAGR